MEELVKECPVCKEQKVLYNVFDAYICCGIGEIYADMLKQCYDIEIKEETALKEMCDVCIFKLRDAYYFKLTVLESLRQLKEKCIQTKNINNQTQNNTNLILNTELDEETGLMKYYLKPPSEKPVKNAVKKKSDMFKNTYARKAISKLSENTGELPKHSVIETSDSETLHAKNRINKFSESTKLADKNIMIETSDNTKILAKYTVSEDSDITTDITKNTDSEMSENTTVFAKYKVGSTDDEVLAENPSSKLSDDTKSAENPVNELSDNAEFEDYCIEADNDEDTVFEIFFNEQKRNGTEQKSFTCPICSKDYSNKIKLKNHLVTHMEGPFPCGNCDQVFSKWNTRNSHQWRVHKTDAPYVCSECGHRFNTFHKRLKHMQDDHGMTEPKYPCQYCDRKYFYAGARSTHIRFSHLRERNHKCEKCTMAFDRRRSLLAHMACAHGIGEKKHGCAICGKLFYRHITLQYHMKTHDKHQYKCDYHQCGAVFTNEVAMTCHLRFHQLEMTSESAIEQETLETQSVEELEDENHFEIVMEM